MWRRRLEDVGGSQAAATVESAFCSPSPFASGFYARPPPKRPPPPNQNFQQIDTYIFLKIRLSTEMKTILLPGILVN